MLILISLFQIILFAYINRITIFSPLFIILFTSILIQYIASPIFLIFTGDQRPELMMQEYSYLLTVINVVIFFWFLGFTLVSNKEKFKFFAFNEQSKANNLNRIRFALFCLVCGMLFYILIFIYTGYGFIEALLNPLQFRFDIISLTGGYYLRNLSIWLINLSVISLLIFYFRDFKDSLFKKFLFILISIFLVIILLPFGQRSIVFIPFIAIIFILYNDKLISNLTLLLGLSVGFFLLAFLGIYRTIAFFGVSDLGSIYYILLQFQSFEFVDFIIEIIKRFDNLTWLNLYLGQESYFSGSRSFLESFKQLFLILVPPSILGGIEKQIDYDTFLTIYFLGSQDFGSFGFTPIAEWSMNLGKIGFIIMPFISGVLMSLICNAIRNIKNNMFCLIMFSSLIFLNMVFISIHSYGTAEVIVFLVFNIGIYICYKIFFDDMNQRVFNS